MGFWGARKFGQARLGEVSIGDRIVFEADGTAARPVLDWASEIGVGLRRSAGYVLGSKSIGGSALTTSVYGYGGVTAAGDLAAAGGFRSRLAQVQAPTITNVGESALSATGQQVLRAGSVVGLSYSASGGIAFGGGGGRFRIRVYKNGALLLSSTWIVADVPAGLVTGSVGQVWAKDTYTFAANDILQVTSEVDTANLAGATGNIGCYIQVEE